MNDLKHWMFSSVLLVAVFGPGIACAALGEPEASVQADVAQFQGSIKVTDKVTQRAAYRLHEIQLSSGTVVREFAALNGTVFAVAWSGPTVPNLPQTLGKYFDNYVAAAKLKHAGHDHLQVQQSDLVIQASGHMRAFSGRAYLPQAVPDGVSVGDLH